MAYYKDDLKELQEKIARKKQLSIQIENLRLQKKQLINKVNELEKIKIKEEYDVEKLERSSLANLFYNVFGKMNEKLEKEEDEAYLASVKYDVALRELYALEEDLERKEVELKGLGALEKEYAILLAEKTASLKNSNGEIAVEIIHLEETISSIEHQKKELKEAIYAGERALNTVQKVITKLNNAEGWATWDLLGGGILSDLAKHSSLDEAQGLVTQLQLELRTFQTELSDVTVHANIQVSIDGFMRFADYFFDGLFADWTVMDKINQSQESVQRTKEEIMDVVSDLRNMLEVAEDREASVKKELDDLIVNSKVE